MESALGAGDEVLRRWSRRRRDHRWLLPQLLTRRRGCRLLKVVISVHWGVASHVGRGVAVCRVGQCRVDLRHPFLVNLAVDAGDKRRPKRVAAVRGNLLQDECALACPSSRCCIVAGGDEVVRQPLSRHLGAHACCKVAVVAEKPFDYSVFGQLARRLIANALERLFSSCRVSQVACHWRKPTVGKVSRQRAASFASKSLARGPAVTRVVKSDE